MKFCIRCCTNKLLAEFSKRSASLDGLQPYCSICLRKYQQEYYKQHKDKKDAQVKGWRAKNRSRYLLQTSKQHREKHLRGTKPLVYIIKGKTLYKIGRTTNLPDRLHTYRTSMEY